MKLSRRFIDFGFYGVSQFCRLLDTLFSKEAGLDYQKNTWPIEKLVSLIPQWFSSRTDGGRKLREEQANHIQVCVKQQLKWR